MFRFLVCSGGIFRLKNSAGCLGCCGRVGKAIALDAEGASSKPEKHKKCSKNILNISRPHYLKCAFNTMN